MPRKKKIKEPVVITPLQQQIINGYTMGDGFLSPDGSLTVDHGSDQEKFTYWMLEALRDLCTENRKVSVPTRVRNGITHKSYRFNTRNVLKEYRAIWYPEGKKRLPKTIETMFTPLFIAVWYACDGTRIQGSLGARFEVTAFTPEERKQLQELFSSRYNIKSVINRGGTSPAGKDLWSLCINAADYPKFHELVTRDTDLIETLFPQKLHSVKK